MWAHTRLPRGLPLLLCVGGGILPQQEGAGRPGVRPLLLHLLSGQFHPRELGRPLPGAEGVLPYFHRYFFRATGSVYLGPMVTCLVLVVIMLTNNACYIPR